MAGVDISLLERALRRLKEGLASYDQSANDELHRDGLIQRFEFTFELAHAVLRRHLEAASSGGDAVDRMSFPALIRAASEQGLMLNGWDVWEGFRTARNKTSHTYDEAMARAVVEILPSFVLEVEFMVMTMKARPM